MSQQFNAPATDAGQEASSATSTAPPPPHKDSRPGPEPPALVTIKAFSHCTSMSVRSVEKLIQDKRIPVIRLSRKIVRIPLQEAMDHLRRNYTINAR